MANSLRPRSRSSSLASQNDEGELDDIAKALMNAHKFGKPYVLIESTDQKTRVMNFSGKRTISQTIRVSDRHVYAVLLKEGDEVVAYFGATKTTPAGWFSSHVRGVYDSKEEATAGEKQLKKKKKNPKPPRQLGKTNVDQMRRILTESGESIQPSAPETDLAALPVLNTPDEGNGLNDSDSVGDATHDHEPIEEAGNEFHADPEEEEHHEGDGDHTMSFATSSPSDTSSGSMAGSSTPTTGKNKRRCDNATLKEAVANFYWKVESGGSHQLRKGYKVFVMKSVLKDLYETYGPDSGCRNGWSTYAWKLVLHLLGGTDDAIKLKKLQKFVGVDALLNEETLLAVKGHVTELFQLKQKIMMGWFKQKMNNNLNGLIRG